MTAEVWQVRAPRALSQAQGVPMGRRAGWQFCFDLHNGGPECEGHLLDAREIKRTRFGAHGLGPSQAVQEPEAAPSPAKAGVGCKAFHWQTFRFGSGLDPSCLQAVDIVNTCRFGRLRGRLRLRSMQRSKPMWLLAMQAASRARSEVLSSDCSLLFSIVLFV